MLKRVLAVYLFLLAYFYMHDSRAGQRQVALVYDQAQKRYVRADSPAPKIAIPVENSVSIAEQPKEDKSVAEGEWDVIKFDNNDTKKNQPIEQKEQSNPEGKEVVQDSAKPREDYVSLKNKEKVKFFNVVREEEDINFAMCKHLPGYFAVWVKSENTVPYSYYDGITEVGSRKLRRFGVVSSLKTKIKRQLQKSCEGQNIELVEMQDSYALLSELRTAGLDIVIVKEGAAEEFLFDKKHFGARRMSLKPICKYPRGEEVVETRGKKMLQIAMIPAEQTFESVNI